jgi:hypothetical protein
MLLSRNRLPLFGGHVLAGEVELEGHADIGVSLPAMVARRFLPARAAIVAAKRSVVGQLCAANFGPVPEDSFTGMRKIGCMTRKRLFRRTSECTPVMPKPS